MIIPLFKKTIHRETGTSFGLSSCGYDIRLAQDIEFPNNVMVLASSMEYFDMPTDVMARVCDKSSLVRRGITVQNTVIEPGWRGYLTLELKQSLVFVEGKPIANQLHELKAGTPIAQIVFELLDQHTIQPYNGKYQNQLDRPQPALEEK
jgi:dCTP deaminase